mmetsp:Transcript_153946/g.269348  ORF Transcript_153946/g.269348 Transcript_153946/m.269348 type:complete len:219 (-) Transcript_153946:4-660(-)
MGLGQLAFVRRGGLEAVHGHLWQTAHFVLKVLPREEVESCLRHHRNQPLADRLNLRPPRPQEVLLQPLRVLLPVGPGQGYVGPTWNQLGLGAAVVLHHEKSVLETEVEVLRAHGAHVPQTLQLRRVDGRQVRFPHGGTHQPLPEQGREAQGQTLPRVHAEAEQGPQEAVHRQLRPRCSCTPNPSPASSPCRAVPGPSTCGWSGRGPWTPGARTARHSA